MANNKRVDPHREVKRQKDIATIRELFSVFPRPLVDRVLREAAWSRIHTDHIDCLEVADEYIYSTLFHLHDTKLYDLLADFFRNWNLAWEVGRTTHHDYLHRGLATLMLSDTDPSERWKEHEVYLNHVTSAQCAMSGLTKHLHEAFPEVDLAETDREATRKYQEAVEKAKKIAESWGKPRQAEESADRPEKLQTEPSVDKLAGGVTQGSSGEYLIKVEKLKEMLVSRANGGTPDEKEYAKLRRELVAIPAIRNALPEFVRRCGTIREFWNFIKPMFESDKYRQRTQYLQEEFMPILETLEGEQALPDLSRPRDPVAPDQPKPRPDVVLVTVNEHETKAVHDAFLEATGAEGVPVSLEGRLYHNLGTINGTTVYHAISEMGSSGPGAMQQAVDKAIRALDPGAVIALGIAFGVSEKDQSLGDILLSKQIQLYDLQRAGTEIVLRGDKPHATPRLINHFDAFNQVKWEGAKVRPGLILSGEKLIDDKDYRDQLVALQVEAVGGEMEGAGLYVASADHKVDWIVIKAICDWADGNKRVNKNQRQKKAAKNAVEFLVESLKYAALKRLDAEKQRRP